MPAFFSFEAIGTHWRIKIEEELSSMEETTLLAGIRERILRFEETYSRFREDSLVKKTSRQPGRYVFPEDATPLFALYQQLARETGELFTPIMGTLLEAAGYDQQYSLKVGILPTLPSLADALEIDQNSLTTKQPVLLDFGAAGKGHLIDLVGELLQAQGYKNFVIDAGGDILHRTTRGETLRVGLEHPLNTQQAIGIATIQNKSICGSAGNRRAWKNFHHIINPHTKTSPTEVIATWVVAESTILADALATCLFFVEPTQLLKEHVFSCVRVFQDLSIEKMADFPAELF